MDARWLKLGLAVGGLLVLGLWIVQQAQWRRKQYKFPDGPRGLPIIGNLLQLPAHNPGLLATEWANKYGEMTYTRMGRLHWVIINSSRVMRDLFEKRSKLYSSRPHYLVAQDGFSHGNRIVMMPYGKRWRDIRKIMHSVLMTSSARTRFAPFQDIESRQLCYEYLTDPTRAYVHNARFANSVIMSVVFGVRIKPGDKTQHALFETADTFLESISVPRFCIPMFFPFLARLPNPLKWWRADAEREFEKTVGVYRTLFNGFFERQTKGEQADCFATSLIELTKDWQYDQTQMHFVAGKL